MAGPNSTPFHQYQQQQQHHFQQQQQQQQQHMQQQQQQQPGLLQHLQQNNNNNNNNNNNPQENGGPPNQQGQQQQQQQQGQSSYGPPGSASGTGASNPQGPPGAGAPPPPPPQQPPAEYTLAGVLHYLQSEWRRYERDRNEWEIERAEMRARIALLEGERRGAENLKTDLMRRVKMLEFALRQERSKYLAQSSAAAGSGSPGPNSATVGTPPVGGLPAAILAKHPLVHVDKASSSGRSSPVARSEDLGKDVFGAGNAATFQAHPLRGPSNLSTNSFTASSLSFNGASFNAATFNNNASTVLFNPATLAGGLGGGAGPTNTSSMLSRHTSLARDGKSRAKSRDYLKQCLLEIGYLTNPATLNPLNERAYISGAVGFSPPQQQQQQQSNGPPAGAGAGALGLASGGGANAPPQQPPTGILRPRKVMYEDAGSGIPPPLPPPPPPPTVSLPNQGPHQSSSSSAGGSAPGFIVQGGSLEQRPSTITGPDASSAELNGSGGGGSAMDDPLGASAASQQTIGRHSTAEQKMQPQIHVFSPNDDGDEAAAAANKDESGGLPAPVEDAAEMVPAPSPSGAAAIVPDVPPPTPAVAVAVAAGAVAADGESDAHSSSSSSSEGDDDRSSNSSSTTLEGETGEKADGDASVQQKENKGGSDGTGRDFEQRSGAGASGPDRMSFDFEGHQQEQQRGGESSTPSTQQQHEEGDIEDEVDDEEPMEEQRTAIYRPGGLPSSAPAPGAGAGAGAGTGSIAEATPDDWRRLREAGAAQRQRRERERAAMSGASATTTRQQAPEGQGPGAAAAADALADARAHLAETTERVNALLAGEGGGGGSATSTTTTTAASAGRPPLARTSSGRADEDELANLKLDPVPDEAESASGSGGMTNRRRSRAGSRSSALSAATSSEAVPDSQPWKARRVLRGHLDAVRAVGFDSVEPSVLSAGDDCTIKYWRFDPSVLGAGAGGAGGAGGSLSRESSFSSMRSGAGGGSGNGGGGGAGGGGGGGGGTGAADYPIVTYRGHTEPVTCLTVGPPIRATPTSPFARRIYSASLDASIRVWPAPEVGSGGGGGGLSEAYPPVEQTVELGALVGHTDAVWDLELFSHLGLLVSVAADGMVKVWSTSSSGSGSGSDADADGDAATEEVGGGVSSSPGKAARAADVGSLNLSWDYFGLDAEDEGAVETERAAFLKQAQEGVDGSSGAEIRNGGLPVPTTVSICHSNIRLCAVGYTNAAVKLFDVTSGKAVMKLQSEETKDGSLDSQINCVVTHPTLPILFTAHESGHIRMFDLNSGACTMSMVGHLDSVTTLDIDPAGLTLVSGGHDCSVRFWDIMGAPSSSTTSATDAVTLAAAAAAATDDEAGSNKTTASAATAAVSVRDACVQEITSHRKKAEEGVLAVRYHPSAPFFASAGADGVVRLFG